MARRAILDACVIIPAALRDTLLRAAEAGQYLPGWSESILQEVQRNLAENHLTTAHQAQTLVDRVRDIFPEALVTGYEQIIDSMTNDVKDRHVLAAAVVGGAQVIVTANLADLPRQALEPFNVVAQSPDAFLLSLFAETPDTMARVIIGQAADLVAPPLSVSDVIEMIAAQHAPTFAALVADRVAELS